MTAKPYPVNPGRRGREVLVIATAGLVVFGAGYLSAAGPSPFSQVALPAVALGSAFVLGVRKLRHVLLGLVLLDLPLQWDLSLAFRPDAAAVGAEPGLNVSLTTLALSGLVALWAADRLAERDRAAPPTLRPALPLLVYVAVSAASIAVANDAALGGFQLALLFQTLVLFIYVASTVRSRADVEFVLAMLMLGLLFEGALLLLIYASDVSFNVAGLNTWSPGPDDPDFGYTRVGGTLGPPNTAAGYLAVLLPVAVGVSLSPRFGRVRQLAIAALLLGFPALLVTGSRGGWASFLVACVVLLIVAKSRRLLTARAALATTLAAVALVLPVGSLVAQRVTGAEADEAALARIPLASLALDMIEERPTLGLGLNNVGLDLPSYAGPEYAGVFLYTVHNKYLLTAAESGLFALAAFVWFLVATVRRGIRCARAADIQWAMVGAGLLAGLAGHLVHMAVDIFTSRPQVQLLWLVAALLVSVETMLQKDIDSAQNGERRISTGLG